MMTIRKIVSASCIFCVFLSGATQAQTSRHALIIGVDGLRPSDLQIANTPNIDALIANGSISLTATNTWLPTNAYNGHSAPNWATLLTGYTPTVHGIGVNGDGNHFIDDDATNPASGSNLPTILGRAGNSPYQYETTVVNTWGGIGMGSDSVLEFSQTAVDTQYRAGSPNLPLARDMQNTQAAVNMLLGQAGGSISAPNDVGGTSSFFVPGFENTDPDLMFVHIGSVDGVGHNLTFGSSAYRDAIEDVDLFVGQLTQAIADRSNADSEEWLIVLSSDHGGATNSGSHTNNSDVNIRTIPLIVSGDRIADATSLSNASLYDIAPTVLSWLGVDHAGTGFIGQDQLVLDGLGADLSGDGFVGARDLDIVLANWGQITPHGLLDRGDANGDGTVGLADLNIVLDNWSNGSPPDVNVPEPTSLLGFGALMFAIMRRP